MSKKARKLTLSLSVIALVALGAVAGSALSPIGSSSAESQRSGHPAGYIVQSSDPISTTSSTPTRARFPSGADNDEISPTGAEPVKPCSLVPVVRAATILGGAVKATERPQGPTCVFAERGSKRAVTVTVEATSISSLRHHAGKSSPVGVAGQSGWCVRYGSTSVVVPLGEGKVLHVTGPCTDAARFAAQALPRLER